MIDFDKLLTVQEVAKRLKMSGSNVRYLLRCRKLKGYKLSKNAWRVLEDDLEAFMQGAVNIPDQPELLGE